MNRVLLRLLPFIAICAHGCMGPGEPPAPPSAGSSELPQTSGSWTYSATYSVNLGAPGTVTCSMSGVKISLSQSGSSISGTAHGGESVCDSPSFGLELGTVGNPIVIRGTVDENSINLKADGFVLLSHEGTMSGNSMSGTVTGTGTVAQIGFIRVTGNWSASR